MTTITSFSGRYSFLSNFSPAPVRIQVGTKWVRCATVEHAYQASKTLVPHERIRIAHADTPAEAKRLGKAAKRVAYWEDVKTIVMLELLRQKFSRSLMRRSLLATGHAELVEGNHWHDNEWGVCECAPCRARFVAPNGERLAGNKLGLLLMRVRKDIRR